MGRYSAFGLHGEVEWEWIRLGAARYFGLQGLEPARLRDVVVHERQVTPNERNTTCVSEILSTDVERGTRTPADMVWNH